MVPYPQPVEFSPYPHIFFKLILKFSFWVCLVSLSGLFSSYFSSRLLLNMYVTLSLLYFNVIHHSLLFTTLTLCLGDPRFDSKIWLKIDHSHLTHSFHCFIQGCHLIWFCTTNACKNSVIKVRNQRSQVFISAVTAVFPYTTPTHTHTLLSPFSVSWGYPHFCQFFSSSQLLLLVKIMQTLGVYKLLSSLQC